MSSRSGIGYDSHRYADDRPLVLGGVEIPGARGLDGHSDADVLTHALIDALLGAAGLGDIGQHFPDTDERYRDADSLELLSEVCSFLEEHGWNIRHLDAKRDLRRAQAGSASRRDALPAWRPRRD